MSFPPEAFLIGGEKCGTTTLVDLLAQHPMISISEPRDSDYFTRNFDQGLDWYRSLFGGPSEAIWVDVSLSYSCAPLAAADCCKGELEHLIGTPRRIFDANPGARFLYVLRDPVSRTYSSYWHAVRHGNERRPFREAVEQHWRYLDQSDYAGQIERYLEYFDISKFRFVLFDDLIADPVSTAQECFKFLGAKPHSHPVHFTRAKNVGFEFNALGRGLRRLFVSSERMANFVNAVKIIVPPPLRPLASRVIVSEVPPLDEVDRRLLLEHFAAKVQRLERLLGLPLDIWQSARRQ